MTRLAGKVALITGGAGGIGGATARAFVREGARVVIADVREESAAETAADLGPDALGVQLDVSRAADWDRAVAAGTAQFGRLDVLVNAAGHYRPAPLAEATEEDLTRMFQVNQLGTFLGMKAVTTPMTAAGGGSIINVSSDAGMFGMRGLSSYSSTKFAIRGLSACAAMELGDVGIRVNSVHPGGIDTPMVRRAPDAPNAYAALPVPRVGRPDEVAGLILFLASDESSYCTGSEFVVDGGMGAGFPLASRGAAG